MLPAVASRETQSWEIITCVSSLQYWIFNIQPHPFQQPESHLQQAPPAGMSHVGTVACVAGPPPGRKRDSMSAINAALAMLSKLSVKRILLHSPWRTAYVSSPKHINWFPRVRELQISIPRSFDTPPLSWTSWLCQVLSADVSGVTNPWSQVCFFCFRHQIHVWWFLKNMGTPKSSINNDIVISEPFFGHPYFEKPPNEQRSLVPYHQYRVIE